MVRSFKSSALMVILAFSLIKGKREIDQSTETKLDADTHMATKQMVAAKRKVRQDHYLMKYETDVNYNMESVECHKGDGFGAQYICQMAAFACARGIGDCFNYHSFSIGGFHKNSKFDPEEFTGIKSDDQNRCVGAKRSTEHPANCGRGLRLNPTWYTREVRDELRSMYHKNPKPELDAECDVAFHARRGDAWSSMKMSNKVIHDVIVGVFPNKKVCLISEQSDFGEVKTLKNVVFKLDEPAKTSFHRLVSAPEMVMGASSFSYSAAILNKGTVYFVARKGNTNATQISSVPLLWDYEPIVCKSGVCEVKKRR